MVDLVYQNCWNSIVNQSVLHCWIHKLVVFKVIGTNCILLVQFLYTVGHLVFPPEVSYTLLGSACKKFT